MDKAWIAAIWSLAFCIAIFGLSVAFTDEHEMYHQEVCKNFGGVPSKITWDWLNGAYVTCSINGTQEHLDAYDEAQASIEGGRQSFDIAAGLGMFIWMLGILTVVIR